MILTRQTCGHRSSMVAASNCQALAFYFSVRIWYMILISKCREESDLGLCMRLPKRMPLRSADFRRILRPNTFKNRKSTLRSGFFLQVLNSYTDLDQTLLYISILKTHAEFVRTNTMIALGVCFSQPCSSAGRRFAVSRSCLNHYGPNRSFPQRPIR